MKHPLRTLMLLLALVSLARPAAFAQNGIIGTWTGQAEGIYLVIPVKASADVVFTADTIQINARIVKPDMYAGERTYTGSYARKKGKLTLSLAGYPLQTLSCDLSGDRLTVSGKLSIGALAGINAQFSATRVRRAIGIEVSEMENALERAGDGYEAVIGAALPPLNITGEGWDGAKIRWTSNKKSVLRVNAQGRLSAIRPGKATVTLTARLGAETATDQITVRAVGLSVSPKKMTLRTSGEKAPSQATVKALVCPTDASEKAKQIIYTVSDENVAHVDDNGRVTALSPGRATVKATNGYGQTASCTVIVR